MDFLVIPLGPLCLGVVASQLLALFATENPSRIPLRRIIPRAAAGVCWFFSFWTACALLVFLLLDRLVATYVDLGVERAFLAFLVGVAIPQSARAKDHFIDRRALEKLRKSDSILARLLPGLVWIVNYIDENTRLYIERIITREERKACYDFLLKGKEGAIHKCFERHKIDIARHAGEKWKFSEPDRILGIPKVRYYSVKFNYLARFLGYSECLKELYDISGNPSSVFPDWPIGLCERRRANADDETACSLHHRMYEQDGVRNYILGKIDSI